MVGFGRTALDNEAFIWDSTNGMRNLRDLLVAQGDDLTGWILSEAHGISADGSTIVGFGRSPAGQIEAWSARLGPSVLIPEPSTLVLFGIGILCLLGYGWRRQKCA